MGTESCLGMSPMSSINELAKEVSTLCACVSAKWAEIQNTKTCDVCKCVKLVH